MREIKSIETYCEFLEKYFRLIRAIMEPTLSMLVEIIEQEPSLKKLK